MKPEYIFLIYFEHNKCTNKMPNNIQYFQRILDNMSPTRGISKRTEQYKIIYYYFDNIGDIYTFYRKIGK
jgi:hypothetical protein